MTNGGDEERLAAQADGLGAEGHDDEELLAALREAVSARRAVPKARPRHSRIMSVLVIVGGLGSYCAELSASASPG